MVLAATRSLCIAIAASAGSTLMFLLWRRRQQQQQLQSLRRLQEARRRLPTVESAAPAQVRILPDPEMAEAPPPELDPELEIILSLRFKPEDRLRPIRTQNAGRSLACNHFVASGEIVLQKRMEAKAPRWPCALALLTASEQAVVRLAGGEGHTFLGKDGDESASESASWVAYEIESMWLLAIRAARISRTSPPVFAALIRLENHLADRPADARDVVHRAAAALSGALHKGANIDVPPPTLATLLGVLLTNAFGLRAPGESVGDRRVDAYAHAFALSLTCSLFNHSCEPNVTTDFVINNYGQVSAAECRGVPSECPLLATHAYLMHAPHDSSSSRSARRAICPRAPSASSLTSLPKSLRTC